MEYPNRLVDLYQDEIVLSHARLNLIREIYECAFTTATTFDGALGRDLVYLFGAIAKGTRCDFQKNTRIAVWLLEQFPIASPVWQHARITLE